MDAHERERRNAVRLAGIIIIQNLAPEEDSSAYSYSEVLARVRVLIDLELASPEVMF